MTFKIGDDIIMTADSGKGDSFYPDGEYKGIVVKHGKKIVLEGSICVESNASNGFMCFNPDGSHPELPGLSIRPAGVDEYEVIGNIFENPGLKDLIIQKVEPTPSQWIEGVPSEPGNYWLLWSDGKSNAFSIKEGISGNFFHLITAYCPISELPPPPPAKEVEAFGFLEYVSRWFEDKEGSEGAFETAFDFYSQLATAKVLNKYLGVKGIDSDWIDVDTKENLDEFIIRRGKSRTHPLLFTPAALKKLGVK